MKRKNVRRHSEGQNKTKKLYVDSQFRIVQYSRVALSLRRSAIRLPQWYNISHCRLRLGAVTIE